MHGNAIYEIARQQIAEQQRAARQAGEAGRRRAEARGRHRKPLEAEPVVPPIPDYAEDLLGLARNTVPAPREEAPKGRPTRSGR